MMEHNIHIYFALIEGMIASCMTFPTLAHEIGVVVDPCEREFQHDRKQIGRRCIFELGMLAVVAVHFWMQ